MTLIPEKDLQAARVRLEQEQVVNGVPPETTKEFIETRRAYFRCANCGHWRAKHCTKRKLKPGEIPSHAKWKGFVDDKGQIQPCQHTPEGCASYVCTSAACAVVIGEGEAAHYCDCKKFVSPFLKKRSAKPPAATTAKPRVSRAELAHKAKILVEVVTENPALTVAELAEASERSSSWVRATLKKHGITLSKPKEKSAFTTGQGVLSIIATVAESAVKP